MLLPEKIEAQHKTLIKNRKGTILQLHNSLSLFYPKTKKARTLIEYGLLSMNNKTNFYSSSAT